MLMKFLERDLEEILYSSNQSEIRKRGFCRFQYGVLLRQFPITTRYRADLVLIQKSGPSSIDITILELKRRKIDISAVSQAFNYAAMLRQIFFMRQYNNAHVRVMLVGDSVELSESDKLLMACSYFHPQIFTFSYSHDGVRFKNYWLQENIHLHLEVDDDEPTVKCIDQALRCPTEGVEVKIRCNDRRWQKELDQTLATLLHEN